MSTLQNQINLIKQEKDSKILPENIREGVTIFNVTGTMTGGASTVKQFDSIANMQADPSPSSGDLAIVYASTQSNFTEDTQTQFITFPETVTLPSSIGEDYAQVQLQAVDESVMLDCWGDLSSTMFNVSIYIEIDGNYKEYRIQYESSDGLNYTRTRFESGGESLENPVDLTTLVKWGSRYGEAQWNDLIGYFMIVGSTTYEGLYEYNGTNNLYEYAPTQLNAISEDVYGKSFYNGNGKFDGSLQNVNNLSIDEVKRRVNLFNDLGYLELDENVTNVVNMFSSCSNLTTVPNFDTSNIIDMYGMFSKCNNLTTIPNFDTSNVKNMSGMFMSCNRLTTVPNFNMSNVNNAMYMYVGCSNLSDNALLNISISVPLASQINYPLVNYFGIGFNRFNNTSRDILFNKGYLDCDLNTEGWSTRYNINGTLVNRGKDFDRYGEIINASIPNTTYVNIDSDGLDNGILFSFKTGFQQKFAISNLNIKLNTSNIFNLQGCFWRCGSLINISNFNTSNVTNMYMTFAECYNLVTIPNYDLSNTVDMGSMFYNCQNLTTVPNFNTINVKSMYETFKLCWNLKTLPNFNTSNVITMYNMFWRCYNLTTVSNFNTINVKSMYNTFAECIRLNNIPSFDTSNVNSMSGMFYGCNNLTTVPEFNTIKVVDMGGVFSKCSSLKTVPNFNTSNVVNMAEIFNDCRVLENVPNFNTSKVTNMAKAFLSCYTINSIPDFETNNVINMSLAFCGCTKLLNIPNFNLSKATDTSQMLGSCWNILEVPNFDTSNATNMYCMFAYCEKLTSIPNYNTSKADNIGGFLVQCTNLTTVPNFDTSKAYNMGHMFQTCYNLKNVPFLNTSNAGEMAYMFDSCRNLTDVPQFNTSNVYNMVGMFKECNNLSNGAIQNIINMVLNSSVSSSTWKNINNTNQYSPLLNTPFDNSYYSNRLDELTAAGWSY